MKKLCGIALLVLWAHQVRPFPKDQQQHSTHNAVPVENLKDQVGIGGEVIPSNLRQSTCEDVSPNCHLNVHNCPSNKYVQDNCQKTCGLCGDCGGEFISNNGTIRYPLNGGQYGNNEECTWIIRATHPIKITFTRFNVESYYDNLYVRDGDTIESAYLGNFTGDEIPSPITTSKDSAYLYFISDYSITKTGFELHWERSGCGAEYTSSSGMIRHPVTNANYQNDENCIWVILISVPITITFGSFDTQRDHDYLYVRDSIGSKLLGKLSGTRVPSPIQISTNAAYLDFTSDQSVTSTGFELTWEPSGSNCGHEYYAESGRIHHPLNKGNYTNYESCIWIIRASAPITITFVRFDTEFTYDYLYIRDGKNIGSPVLGNFTGDSIPSPIQTNSNAAYLLFKSDQSVTSTGFELRWEHSQGSDCACGQANRASRIVGGTETEENEYPWQAALVYTGSSSVFCGASIIGSKHILTAAHCTQAVTDNSRSYQVYVGAHSKTSAASSQLRLEPNRIIQHPDYDSSTLDNDISIIELSDHIDFISSEIRPVCLPDNDDDAYDSVTATVSGWGVTEYGGSESDVLLEVEVPTMSNTQCLEDYGSGITDNMICAGYDEGGKDSCQGDSGGPLIYNSGSGYTQIGVVSWGYGCASPHYPGVYARVTKYLSWISDNSVPSNTCPEA